MLMEKSHIATMLVQVGVFSAGVSVHTYQALAQEKSVADADLVRFVNQRVQACQPTQEEKRLDEIGWVKDIREALRLAKANERPVFLFTHDGRINTGRC